MSAVTPPYEPEVIERFAAQLDARGRSLQRGITLTGGVLGALVGAVPLTPLGDAWPIPHVFGFATLLVGLLCGALIGFVVGSGRAELHRLHAQTVLCQLHAQRATLAIWKLLRDQDERERFRAPAPVAVAPPPAAPLPQPTPALRVTPQTPEPPAAPEPTVATTAPMAPPVAPQVAPPPVSIRSA